MNKWILLSLALLILTRQAVSMENGKAKSALTRPTAELRLPEKQDQLSVETYFLPDDAAALNEKLTTLLESASKRVLIAMYWMTDEFIIEQIIKLKKRNIQVALIIDESSPNSTWGIRCRLSDSKIIPVIYPSQTAEGIGLMHHKLMVIDDKVWTGSANITRAALDPASESYNYENVFIISSAKVADDCAQKFFSLENECMGSILALLANDQNPRPWLKELSKHLYNYNPRFVTMLEKETFVDFLPDDQDKLTPTQRRNVSLLLSLPITTQKNNQKKPEKRKIYDDEEPSKEMKLEKEAYQPATETLSLNRPQGWGKYDVPATESQIRLLKTLGLFREGMSKRQAIDTIGEAKDREAEKKFSKQNQMKKG